MLVSLTISEVAVNLHGIFSRPHPIWIHVVESAVVAGDAALLQLVAGPRIYQPNCWFQRNELDSNFLFSLLPLNASLISRSSSDLLTPARICWYCCWRRLGERTEEEEGGSEREEAFGSLGTGCPEIFLSRTIWWIMRPQMTRVKNRT